MTAASALAAACTLAEHGFAVFPCRPDKTPATRHGHKDAVKDDPDAVENLWRRYPGELVGVACGEASGISVLDLDKKHRPAWDWWGAHRDRLLPTRVHRTRSGGLHLIYRHREGIRNSEGLIAKGVDTRGTGGYSIWWPSAGFPVLADPGIHPWPEWLTIPAPAPMRPSISTRAIAARGGDLRPTLHRSLGIIRAVLDAQEGERNRMLFWAACRAREMVVSDELDHAAGVQVIEALRNAAAEIGLTQREIDKTITSAMRAAA
jgi:hypothetical protein